MIEYEALIAHKMHYEAKHELVRERQMECIVPIYQRNVSKIQSLSTRTDRKEIWYFDPHYLSN